MNRAQWLNHLRQVDRERDMKKALEKVDTLIDQELKEQEEVTMKRAGIDTETDREAIELHISSGKVRAAYYNAYCNLRDLEDAARDLRNERMGRDAREALNHLDHIHDEIDDKYKWD